MPVGGECVYSVSISGVWSTPCTVRVSISWLSFCASCISFCTFCFTSCIASLSSLFTSLSSPIASSTPHLPSLLPPATCCDSDASNASSSCSGDAVHSSRISCANFAPRHNNSLPLILLPHTYQMTFRAATIPAAITTMAQKAKPRPLRSEGVTKSLATRKATVS